MKSVVIVKIKKTPFEFIPKILRTWPVHDLDMYVFLLQFSNSNLIIGYFQLTIENESLSKKYQKLTKKYRLLEKQFLELKDRLAREKLTQDIFKALERYVMRTYIEFLSIV